MKALFTSFPAYGHAVPLAPLARAARDAGDEAVFAVAPELAVVTGDLRSFDVGPGLAALMAENARQTDFDPLDHRTDNALEERELEASVVRLFTELRADLAHDEVARAIDAERPDVIVAEMWDFVAPIVAAERGIPWVRVIHSPATPTDQALADGMTRAAEARDVAETAPVLDVQLWPARMQRFVETRGATAGLPAVGMRPAPSDRGVRADIPAFDDESRPTVLVTLGTVVDDAALLRSGVNAALAAGANVIATTGVTGVALDGVDDPDRVRAVPFAPMSQLLERADAVVAAGGSGTALAAASRGIPVVFVPRIANQPLVADLVSSESAGIVSEDPAGIADAVAAVLGDPAYREAAADLAERLAEAPTPDEAWRAVRDAVGRASDTDAA